MSPVELAIQITTDADNATRGVADVAASYDDLTAAADQAGRASDDAARRLDTAASGAKAAGDRIEAAAGATDHLDSTAAGLTGGLGALSSGFELVGAEGYAENIQKAAMATDFFSGVGELATVALEKLKLGTLAQAAATRVAQIAQWAWNAAMTANPIGLIVLAIAAVIAIVIVAYKKVGWFRAGVQAAMRGARVAVGWVVDKIGDLVSWVRIKVPAAWRALTAVVSGVARRIAGFVTGLVSRVASAAAAIRDRFAGAWTAVRDKAAAVWAAILDKVNTVKSKLGDAASWMRDRIKDAFNAMLAPIQAIIDKVQWLIDKIKSIKLPHIPGLRTTGRGGDTGPGPDDPGLFGGGGGGDSYTFYIDGVIGDHDDLIDALTAALERRDRRHGRR